MQTDNEKQSELELLFTHSYLTSYNSQCCTRPKPETGTPSGSSRYRSKSLVFLCCLLRHCSRKLDWKWNNWDCIWHWYKILAPQVIALSNVSQSQLWTHCFYSLVFCSVLVLVWDFPHWMRQETTPKCWYQKWLFESLLSGTAETNE